MVDGRAVKTWEDAVVWLRRQPDKQQLVLDAFYDDPLIESAERYYSSDEWQAVVKILRHRGGRALDVGAGRGIASYALARSGFLVTALEPDPSIVVGASAIRQLVTETRLPIEVVEDFSEHLPFTDGTFDVVFARAVLHHMSDLNAACQEMFRVLRPGGLLIAAREHVISKEADLRTFLDQHPLHHLYGGENAYVLDRYVSALEAAGFVSVEVLAPLKSPINLFPYTVETLRGAAVERLAAKVPVRFFWRAALASDPVFTWLLSLMERFDHRPGRLYSFVCHKA